MSDLQPTDILERARDMFAGQGEQPSWTRLKVVLLLLHIAALIYTGSHGIVASLSFAGSSDWAKAAQIAGVVITEATVLYIFVQWALGHFTEMAESLVAGAVYLLCLALAGLNALVDATLNAGVALTGILLWHLDCRCRPSLS